MAPAASTIPAATPAPASNLSRGRSFLRKRHNAKRVSAKGASPAGTSSGSVAVANPASSATTKDIATSAPRDTFDERRAQRYAARKAHPNHVVRWKTLA